jgi:hypothetical protein
MLSNLKWEAKKIKSVAVEVVALVALAIGFAEPTSLNAVCLVQVQAGADQVVRVAHVN